MKGKRCQVCDGPVVNGRCKLCGMPYRNDEVLYHLNESRTKHYDHATPKAREIMRQQQVPLGDKTTGNSSYGRNVSKDKNSRQTLTKEQIRAQQEQVRKEAMEKMTATRVPASAKQQKKNNKKKGAGSIWWIIIFFYVIIKFILES